MSLIVRAQLSRAGQFRVPPYPTPVLFNSGRAALHNGWGISHAVLTPAEPALFTHARGCAGISIERILVFDA